MKSRTEYKRIEPTKEIVQFYSGHGQYNNKLHQLKTKNSPRCISDLEEETPHRQISKCANWRSLSEELGRSEVNRVT